MFKCLILAITITLASAGHVNFIDCGHHEVKSLDVSHCSGKYCVLHKGQEVTLDAVIEANQNSNKLELVLIASVNGIDIEVPGIERDGCKYVKCPIVKGKSYDIKYSYQIPKALPDIKANLTAKVQGDHGLVFCLRVQGEIGE